jgi:dCTP deaminase
MLLSADEIKSEIERGNLIIDPFDQRFFKPSSYLFRLGNRFRRWKKSTQPLKLWSPQSEINQIGEIVKSSEISLYPNEILLSCTLEAIQMPYDLVGILSTPSHLARFGISVNLNSTLVSPGFGADSPSKLTLEIVSFNPAIIQLKSGIPICHLIIFRISNAVKLSTELRNSIYEGREAPCPPLLFEEFKDLLNNDG